MQGLEMSKIGQMSYELNVPIFLYQAERAQRKAGWGVKIYAAQSKSR